jgi:hypothetical protein
VQNSILFNERIMMAIICKGDFFVTSRRRVT